METRNDINRNADAAETSHRPNQPGLVERIKPYMPHLLIALTVLLGFSYVFAFGVDMYWADDWMVRPMLYDRYTDGTLTLTDLWRQHNEHRLFFPKLVMLVLGTVSHGNALADLYFSQVLLVIILLFHGLACRNQFPRYQAAWVMVPIAFLVFSFRQHDNLLWSFQTAFIMVVAAAAAAFYCISRIRDEHLIFAFIGAALAATVGAYSSIQGLLIWPVGCGQLLISPLSRRRKIVVFALWTVLTIAEWLLFFYRWESPSYHPPLGFSVYYFVLAVGGALASDRHWGLICGICLITFAAAAVAFVVVKRQWQEQSYWLATMAFSIAALLAIMMGRAGFGPHQMLISRYATYGLPLAVAVFAILASQNKDAFSRPGMFFMRASLGLILISVTICFFRGIVIGYTCRLERLEQRHVLETLESQPDEAILFCTPKEARVQTAILKRLNYGPLRSQEEIDSP